MNAIRKWWILAGFAVLLAAGLGVWTWTQGKSDTTYRSVKVEKGPITASVSASGTLSPVVSVQVGSQVSGQIKELLVDFNSEVKKDQLIARIDPETFEFRVRQAEADLEAARSQVMTQQASLASQRAQLSQAEVNLAEARRDLERKQLLVDKGFISGAERDKAQAAVNAQVEQVKAAKAQVDVVAANGGNAAAVVKQREAALSQARIDLERTAIKAPVNGVVIKRSVEKGQTVAASLQAPELFIIAENLSDMRVDTSIDESEIGRIRDGQKATFTVDAFPGRTFEGTVRQIRKAAQTVSNVVTYMVEVSAANPNKELLPGMTANVRIITDSRREVFKVPNSALRFRPPGASAQKADAPAEKGADKAAAQAQQGGSGNGGGQGAQATQGGGQMRAMRERLERDLQLSADQKVKLDTIFAGLRERMVAMRDAPAEDRQKISERNRAEMRAQIMEMLTPDQKKKYEEIIAEQSAQGGRNGGANARGRVYVLEAGAPKELAVRLGLTDGTMTEVISPDIKEGMEVIVGASQPGQSSSSAPAPARNAMPGPRMF